VRWPRNDALRAIVDTNVLVSAMGGHPQSYPSRVLDAVMAGSIFVLVSPALLSEYARVLSDVRLTRRHRLNPEQLERYLKDFAARAVADEPVADVLSCPDPADQMLWDLLAAWPDAILVTGERLLQRSDHFPGRILSPREFVETYLAEA